MSDGLLKETQRQLKMREERIDQLEKDLRESEERRVKAESLAETLLREVQGSLVRDALEQR